MQTKESQTIRNAGRVYLLIVEHNVWPPNVIGRNVKHFHAAVLLRLPSQFVVVPRLCDARPAHSRKQSAGRSEKRRNLFMRDEEEMPENVGNEIDAIMSAISAPNQCDDLQCPDVGQLNKVKRNRAQKRRTRKHTHAHIIQRTESDTNATRSEWNKMWNVLAMSIYLRQMNFHRAFVSTVQHSVLAQGEKTPALANVFKWLACSLSFARRSPSLSLSRHTRTPRTREFRWRIDENKATLNHY